MTSRDADAVWTGFYYDGRTAGRQEVSIAIAGDVLRLTKADGSTMRWPIAAVRQSQGDQGRERLRLEFGADPSESLVVEQPGLAEAMRALQPRASPGVRTRREHMRLVGVMLAAVTLLVTAYVIGAPTFARWLAPRVPVEWEQELGRGAAESLLRRGETCTDQAVVAPVRAILDRLLAAGPPSPFEFTLHVSGDTLVNAFAAPGGVVVVNEGLLRAAQSPEELASVLAHEIQHVVLRHSMQAVIREVPVRLGIAAISGNAGVETVAHVAGTLGALRYRREHEREADVEGMKLLQAARVDARGAASFMRRLEARGESAPRLFTYLSSHPHTAQRAAELESLARSATYEPVSLLDAATWQRVQAGCR